MHIPRQTPATLHCSLFCLIATHGTIPTVSFLAEANSESTDFVLDCLKLLPGITFHSDNEHLLRVTPFSALPTSIVIRSIEFGTVWWAISLFAALGAAAVTLACNGHITISTPFCGEQQLVTFYVIQGELRGSDDHSFLGDNNQHAATGTRQSDDQDTLALNLQQVLFSHSSPESFIQPAVHAQTLSMSGASPDCASTHKATKKKASATFVPQDALTCAQLDQCCIYFPVDPTQLKQEAVFKTVANNDLSDHNMWHPFAFGEDTLLFRNRKRAMAWIRQYALPKGLLLDIPAALELSKTHFAFALQTE